MAEPLAEIGRYRVVDRLGEGGMGTLYLARDPALDRLVAIKVLRRGFDDDQLRERFSREARSISRLRHPNIVTIFEYGDFRGQPFIAMEYIAGESLAEVIRRRAALPISRKLQIIEEVCAGMAYAHRAKIVHRDLKPDNIMVDAEGGTIKILDFGIARSMEAEVTRFPQVIGTPSYMSPEQASGQRIDHRSDIFAIGAVFYELLCYRRAFDGDSVATIFEAIQRGTPVPLTRTLPDSDEAIVRVVDRALVKDPDGRYQDLETMKGEIAAARERLGRSVDDTTVVFPAAGGAASKGTPRPSSQLEQLRAMQIRRHLEAANTAIGRHDYETAIESCEQVLLLDQTNASALALIEVAQAAIEDARVQEHLRVAGERLDDQRLTQAENALAEVFKLRAGEPAAVALQRQVGQARNERERARERAAAADLALARGKACFLEGAFEPALRAANEALAHNPQLREALDLKQRAAAAIETRRQEQLQQRADEALTNARRRFEAGDHPAAIAQLEQFLPTLPRIVAALENYRRLAQEIELERRAEQARQQREEQARHQQEAQERKQREERARQQREDQERQQREDQERKQREDQERRDAEQRRIEEARRLQLAEEARQRDRERRAREEAVATLIGDARRLAAAADFGGALRALDEVERLDSKNTEGGSVRELVLAQRAATEAAARRREVGARVNAATAHLDAHRLDQAAVELERAAELAPTDSDVLRLRVRVRAAIDERRRLEDLDRQALATVEEARRRFDGGDITGAQVLLERFEPKQALVTSTLDELRARAKAIDRARQQLEEEKKRHEAARLSQQRWLEQGVRDARTAAGQMRFGDALRVLDEIHRQLPDAPEASQLRETILAARRKHQAAERLRREAVAGIVAKVEAHIARDEVDEAERTLESADENSEVSDELAALRVRVDALSRSRAEQQTQLVRTTVVVPQARPDAPLPRTVTAPSVEARRQPVAQGRRAPFPAVYYLGGIAVVTVLAVIAFFLSGGDRPPVPGLDRPQVAASRNLSVGIVRLPDVNPANRFTRESAPPAPAAPVAPTQPATQTSVIPIERPPAPQPPVIPTPKEAEPSIGVVAVNPPAAPPPPPQVQPQPPRQLEPPPARPPVADTSAADTLAIQRLLNQYVAAYRARDASAVARLDPSKPVGNLDRQFRDLRSYSMELTNVTITLEGDSATATCTKQVEAVARVGNQTLRSPAVATTFKLKRSAGSWAIVGSTP